MTYDPEIHHRRSIRLKDCDYSRNGAYFVTLCSFGRECCFAQFSELAAIVDEQWRLIPKRFPSAIIDAYVIMPNYFHGIIFIDNGVGCCQKGYPQEGHPQGASLQENVQDNKHGCPNLGNIVGSFKSLCATAWLKVIKSGDINVRGKFWQDNYYEHIIRNEEELDRIRNYIADNPLKWEFDRENPANYDSTGTKRPEGWMV